MDLEHLLVSRNNMPNRLMKSNHNTIDRSQYPIVFRDLLRFEYRLELLLAYPEQPQLASKALELISRGDQLILRLNPLTLRNRCPPLANISKHRLAKPHLQIGLNAIELQVLELRAREQRQGLTLAHRRRTIDQDLVDSARKL